MSLIVIASERFADHQTPPGHPEAPERAEVMDVVAQEWRKRRGEVVAPRQATREQLARVHSAEHVRRMAETTGTSVALDQDTYTSPDTYEIALLSAGAGVEMVERVLGGEHQRALALVRPPGHHAERNRAMGFCLFNNVAIGAAHARARGLSRVAIVDYDVHHGNGTQWAFYEDSTVLFISSHQYPFYPGTGAADEIGAGDGVGFTINWPLAAGATDADYERVYAASADVLRQFRPEMLLVSAGFDAHMDDPLGAMRVTTQQFGRLTGLISSVADECCEGRMVVVTEGGYDLRAIAGSLRSVIEVLNSTSALGMLPAPDGPTPRADAVIAAARTHLGEFWTI
jgi:acetoin utilization deacetylase AcuC-like enzyme